MKITSFISILNILKSSKSLLYIILILSFSMGCFISVQDPFLNTWDEQFHALVAKNLSNNMLSPALYKAPTLELDYKNWVGNNIWLHKQPLFLWQIALSIKVFGISELAVRIPSILMHCFTSLFIFGIGKRVINKYVGFFSALLFSLSYYQLELISGRNSTDHNDVAFLFYCTGSFWAWFNYKVYNKKVWLIVLGVFSGGAVLNKWLMGLLVYLIWGGIKLLNERKTLLKKESILELAIPFIVTLFCFLPWQLYILKKYPVESNHEFNYNTRHIYEAIEGHEGSWFFHFDKGIDEMYGDGIVVPFIIILGLIVLLKSIKNKDYKYFLLINVVFTYSFFSFVETKMISYTLIASPFIFLSFGNLIYVTINLIISPIKKYIVLCIVISLSCLGTLNLKKIRHNHLAINNINKYKERMIISVLKKKLKKNDIVFNFNTSPFSNISAMFYSDYEFYNHVPTISEIQLVKQKNFRVVCFDNDDLPNYVIKDSSVIKLKY